MKTFPYFLITLSAALLFAGNTFAQTEIPAENQPEILSEDVQVLEAADSAFTWTPGDLQKKGSRLAIDGKKLPKDIQAQILSDINGEDLNPKWNKYALERNAGLWTLVGGSVLCAGGMAYGGVVMVGTIVAIPIVIVFAEIFTLGNADTDEIVANVMDGLSDKARAGGIVAGVGLAAMTAGTVFLCVGNHKLRKTVRYCNSIGAPQEAAFQFGPTASGGIGLTFNF